MDHTVVIDFNVCPAVKLSYLIYTSVHQQQFSFDSCSNMMQDAKQLNNLGIHGIHGILYTQFM